MWNRHVMRPTKNQSWVSKEKKQHWILIVRLGIFGDPIACVTTCTNFHPNDLLAGKSLPLARSDTESRPSLTRCRYTDIPWNARGEKQLSTGEVLPVSKWWVSAPISNGAAELPAITPSSDDMLFCSVPNPRCHVVFPEIQRRFFFLHRYFHYVVQSSCCWTSCGIQVIRQWERQIYTCRRPIMRHVKQKEPAFPSVVKGRTEQLKRLQTHLRSRNETQLAWSDPPNIFAVNNQKDLRPRIICLQLEHDFSRPKL